MKGYVTEKKKLRRRVFEEIAKFAYNEDDPKTLDDLPFKIVEVENAPYRDTIFMERAVVGERLRAAMGMPLRSIYENEPTSKDIDKSITGETYYEPPLLDIIKFACNCCPDKRVYVTDGCQGCLEHPCMEVCPKKCISSKNGRSIIDDDECIRCGRCVSECPYNAIIKQERPCVKSCGVNAITEDKYGHAQIDQEKCVACGMCLDSCPFAAIVDKGQIYQTIKAINSGIDVYAIVAPSIAGQFGVDLTDMKMQEAFGAIGFKEVVEVAIGADLCTVEEGEHFLRDVPDKMDFMGTSCCPAWAIMAKRKYPEYKDNISMALTPMVLTARLIKKRNPNSKIAFIGPCLSKKQEASRHSVKSFVDFTLTFEEVAGMFTAKDIDFASIKEANPLRKASPDGYGFAKSGGVADAVANYIKQKEPDKDVKIAKAEGLSECIKMMEQAKEGNYDGYLLEGMACPGGCIGGAGTLATINRSEHQLEVAKEQARIDAASENKWVEWLYQVENLEDEFANTPED